MHGNTISVLLCTFQLFWMGALVRAEGQRALVGWSEREAKFEAEALLEMQRRRKRHPHHKKKRRQSSEDMLARSSGVEESSQSEKSGMSSQTKQSSKSTHTLKSSQMEKRHSGRASQQWGLVYSCSNPDHVALTYDDGISDLTPQLLDLLDEFGYPATFFILGQSLEYSSWNQKIARRMAGRHTVASHSWSHDNYLHMGPWAVSYDLQRTSDIIESVIGERPKYFRPPYGYIPFS